MIPDSDRTPILPERVYLRLEDMAADERKKEKNPLVRDMKTRRALAQRVLKEGVGR